MVSDRVGEDEGKRKKRERLWGVRGSNGRKWGRRRRGRLGRGREAGREEGRSYEC